MLDSIHSNSPQHKKQTKVNTGSKWLRQREESVQKQSEKQKFSRILKQTQQYQEDKKKFIRQTQIQEDPLLKQIPNGLYFLRTPADSHFKSFMDGQLPIENFVKHLVMKNSPTKQQEKLKVNESELKLDDPKRDSQEKVLDPVLQEQLAKIREQNEYQRVNTSFQRVEKIFSQIGSNNKRVKLSAFGQFVFERILQKYSLAEKDRVQQYIDSFYQQRTLALILDPKLGLKDFREDFLKFKMNELNSGEADTYDQIKRFRNRQLIVKELKKPRQPLNLQQVNQDLKISQPLYNHDFLNDIEEYTDRVSSRKRLLEQLSLKEFTQIVSKVQRADRRKFQQNVRTEQLLSTSKSEDNPTERVRSISDNKPKGILKLVKRGEKIVDQDPYMLKREQKSPKNSNNVLPQTLQSPLSTKKSYQSDAIITKNTNTFNNNNSSMTSSQVNDNLDYINYLHQFQKIRDYEQLLPHRPLLLNTLQLEDDIQTQISKNQRKLKSSENRFSDPRSSNYFLVTRNSSSMKQINRYQDSLLSSQSAQQDNQESQFTDSGESETDSLSEIKLGDLYKQTRKIKQQLLVRNQKQKLSLPSKMKKMIKLEEIKKQIYSVNKGQLVTYDQLHEI